MGADRLTRLTKFLIGYDPTTGFETFESNS